MASNGFLNRILNRDKQSDTSVGSCCGQVNVVPDEEPSPGQAAGSEPVLDVLVITGSCCSPTAKPFDERAHRVVEEALAAGDVHARVRTVSASDAMAGALPEELLADLKERTLRGTVQLPTVLVNDQVVSSGKVEREEVEAGLRSARAEASA